MFENPFDYYTDPQFWALYFSATLLLGLCIGFAAYTLTIRIANNRRKKKRKKLREKYADIIYEYLAGDLSVEGIRDKQKLDSIDIPVFFGIAENLKENLSGEKEKALEKLLDSPFISDYYYDQLNSISEEKKIEALIYFREKKSINESYYSKLIEWTEEEDHYVAHAAASVILSTDAFHLHEGVLRTMCSKVDSNYRTLIELLWIFWNNDKLDYEQKLEKLANIILDPEVAHNIKAVMIKSMAEFGYEDAGRFIHQTLIDIWDKGDPDEASICITALVHSLRRLDYTESVSTIKEIALSEKAPDEVKISCIKSLAYFRTSEALKSLQKIADEGKENLLKELSFQMYHYDELEQKIEVPAEYKRLYSPNYQSMKLVK